jgi:cytochrome c556
MIRMLMATGVLAVGIMAALAQDPTAALHQIMSDNGRDIYLVLGRMGNGRAPYEQAKIDAALDSLAASVPKIPTVFPAGGYKGPQGNSDYYAKEVAYQPQSADDIKAKVADVMKAIGEQKGKVTDPAGAKAAFGAINGKCDACHDVYRAKKG